MRSDSFKTYGVSRGEREPLVRFMIDALEGQGCTILHKPSPDRAPFRITFATPEGERLGIVAYAFLANNRLTRNRPPDEHRFQIKYGGDLSGLHRVWQDPYGLYVTLLLGINPEDGFFVAADPILHDPTRFSVSVEFKEEHVEKIRQHGWWAWERERRGGMPHPARKRASRAVDAEGSPLFEVLIGGAANRFLRLVRFERESHGEAPGERHYLAEHFEERPLLTASAGLFGAGSTPIPRDRLHALAVEFQLPEQRVLDLIGERRMLKMAVRGSVAEEHLLAALRSVPEVEHVQRLADDHGPDVELRYRGHRMTVECKNSSRVRTAEGWEKIDLQRTRAAKSDPCSRYYQRKEFDLVAACVHAATGRWEFKYAATCELDEHRKCEGRLDNNVKLMAPRWTADVSVALDRACR